MVAFNKVYEGQILFDRHKYQQGNTLNHVVGEWRVKVIKVENEKRGALCSWNNNPPTWYSETRLKKLHLKHKEVK